MANVVTAQATNDGPRNHIVQIAITADGSGDEIRSTVIDPALVNPPCKYFSVKRILGSVSGEFGIRLGFGGPTEVLFMDIQAPSVATQTDDIDRDFRRTGGITDPQAASFTGDIVLTTDGMDAAGDSAQIYLELTKHGVEA